MTRLKLTWRNVVAIVLITWALFLLALNAGCQNDTEVTIKNSARFLYKDEGADSRSEWSLGGLSR